MKIDIQLVLDFLNRNKLRAAYKDVAGYLGVPAHALGGLLGPRRPEASWVVNDETGKPSGYSEPECHPDLRTNDIIADENDLRSRMKFERKTVAPARVGGRRR